MSIVLTTIRDAVKDVLDTVDAKVYEYEPREYDTVPAISLGLPGVRRASVDEQERELGRVDWRVRFPVTVAVRHDDPRTNQEQALELVADLIAAFDDDPTLGNSPGVIDAVISESNPSYSDGEDNRQLIFYDCQLDVFVLVS